MSSSSELSDEASIRQYQVLFSNLYLVYVPFCVVLGLTGNAMVWILIKSNRMLSKLPTNTYLLCLASMSSMFLVFLLIFWLEEVSYRYFNVFHVYAFKNTTLSCKINTFLAHVCDFSSVWLIVLVGCERLVLLYWKTRSLTKERARTQIAILLGVAMLFNSWILGVAKIDPRTKTCDIDQNYGDFYNFMTIMEMIFCIGLPSLIIFISNCLVVCKLNEHLKRHPTSPAVSFNTAEMVLSSNNTCVTQSKQTSYGRLSTRFSVEVQQPMVKQKKGLRYADIQLTRSLLVVTWLFIIMNSPNYIYRIATSSMGISPTGLAMETISLIVHVLLYSHHAFVFYFYIFYSPQMKRRLKPTALKLLECYCFKPPGDYSTGDT